MPFEFDGSYYKEIGNFIGENYLKYDFTKGTLHEVDFLVEIMGLTARHRVLDVGCGPGRHSLELARRGVRMTGVDITPRFIDIAKKQAEEEQLPAEFIVADARELSFASEFDAVICLCEGAFGLAGNLEHHRKILQVIHAALKPGGSFVLTAIHVLCAVRQHTDLSSYDPYTCTSIDREPATSPEGITKEVTYYTTGFTYRELMLLFEEAGFEIVDAYGCIAGQFSRKKLTLEDYEIMMVARKGAE